MKINNTFSWWAILLSALAILVTFSNIYLRSYTPIDGIGSWDIDSRCVVTAVKTGGPGEIAGIKNGDIITGINHVNSIHLNHTIQLEKYRSGDIVTYHISRNGTQFDIPVKLVSRLYYNPWFYFIFYLMIFLVILTGIFIWFKKPGNPSVKLFFIYLQLYAMGQNTTFYFSDDIFATFSNIFFSLSFNIFGIVLLNFHLKFPFDSSILKKYKPFLLALYALGIALGIMTAVLIVLRNTENSSYHRFLFYSCLRWSVTWMSFTLLAALGIAIFQYYSVKQHLARRQLKLVIIGSVFGLLTPVIFGLYPDFFWEIEIKYHLNLLVEIPHAVGSMIMIYCIALAIFRYRIWDIEPFIRSAIFYLMVTLLILILYFPLLWIAGLIIKNRPESLQYIILTTALIIFSVLRNSLQGIIDRLFFRQSYEPAKVVSDFEEKITGLYSSAELYNGISIGINDIFHPDSLLIALKTDKEDLRIQYSSFIDVLIGNDIPISSETKEIIRKSGPTTIEILSQELISKELGEGSLLVPLIQDKELFGLMILGRKKSEQSYILIDINVLGLLAKRIVTAFQTATLYRRDLDRQMMIEKERMRISQDMHDEIGASLTQISILSEVIKGSDDKPEEISKLIEKISGISGNLVDEMSDIIWAINPKYDNLPSFIYYLRKHISEFLVDTQIKAFFDFPFECPEVPMTSDQRRNIFLVIKEALHNSVKHSGASEIYVCIIWSVNLFSISFSDNGRGFEIKDSLHFGNGLSNMRTRIEDMGGFFQMESTKNIGTKLYVELSLN